MYTTNDAKIGTKPVAVRIRRDLLDYIELNCLNRSRLINDALAAAVKIHKLERCIGQCKFSPEGGFYCFNLHD